MADDDKQPKANDQIALYILQERVNELKEAHRQKDERDLKLFQQITDNQVKMSERVLIVETNSQHVSDAIIKLQKESSLQTKLLTGILLAAVSALISTILKSIMGH